MNLGAESEQVEFKRSTGEHREAMESIASILNKHGSGVLYFGVRNDGEGHGPRCLGQDAAFHQPRDWIQDRAKDHATDTHRM